MNDPHDSAFGQRAAQLLDSSLQSLDAATLSRLNRARQAALVSRTRRRQWAWGGAFAGAGVGALALVLVFGLYRTPAPMQGQADTIAAIGDEALLGADDLALYEDLEFFAWLGDAEVDGVRAAATDAGERL